MNLKQTIRRILREELYSPAGKEVIPNKIVIHKSNPMFRDKILQDGLKVRTGECYKIYVGYGIKCRPAIFATNSTNKRAWFDSTYDDDIWEINTEMIPDVKWFKDRHYESRSKHIVTFQDIPKEAITLKYEGTGSGDVKLWSKNSPNIVEESIRRILREETQNPTNIKETLLEKFFNKKFNDVIFEEEPELNSCWLDKDDTQLFIRNWYGVLWVTDCPFYNDLWVKAHMLDFSLDEFHVLLSKFVNKNYEHKNRPIRRVFDSYNCSDLV